MSLYLNPDPFENFVFIFSFSPCAAAAAEKHHLRAVIAQQQQHQRQQSMSTQKSGGAIIADVLVRLESQWQWRLFVHREPGQASRRKRRWQWRRPEPDGERHGYVIGDGWRPTTYRRLDGFSSLKPRDEGGLKRSVNRLIPFPFLPQPHLTHSINHNNEDRFTSPHHTLTPCIMMDHHPWSVFFPLLCCCCQPLRRAMIDRIGTEALFFEANHRAEDNNICRHKEQIVIVSAENLVQQTSSNFVIKL